MRIARSLIISRSIQGWGVYLTPLNADPPPRCRHPWKQTPRCRPPPPDADCPLDADPLWDADPPRMQIPRMQTPHVNRQTGVKT